MLNFQFLNTYNVHNQNEITCPLYRNRPDGCIVSYGGHHEVLNKKGELPATGKIILYFMEAKTMKKTTMPEQLLQKLLPYFS